jgi:hypothetical protein
MLDFMPEPLRIQERLTLRGLVRADARIFEIEALPLLLCFGWYLMVLQAQDSSPSHASSSII